MTATIIVDGGEQEVEDDRHFGETVKRLANRSGIGTFNVKVDGRRVKPQNAPQNFEDVDEVEIVPHDTAARHH